MASPLLSSLCPDETKSQPDASSTTTAPPQLAILDLFFPGFSTFAVVVQRYLHIDLNLYIPLLLLAGIVLFCWSYASQYIWDHVESHFMSVVDIRTDDEIYNILMAWVSAQRFSQGARRFVVNTNLSSRSWYLWRWEEDDEDDESDQSVYGHGCSPDKKKKKPLRYTPSFGTHYFWYRGRLLLFRRTANREQKSFAPVSEREEISISCFGRNPWVLKELLLEARDKYSEKEENKTQIYRGTTRPMSTEATWQRCMSRASRPFSTVILNEKTKKELIDDVAEYLNPMTQRWYANRGIPYRRGYLLHGPPGTGKSSLSLALAGFFNMRIYIVSLSSPNTNEETLGGLFSELPRRCVVLLEDIDSAGLTHTRENDHSNRNSSSDDDDDEMEPGQITRGNGNDNKNKSNRLSLSGLLNILDGVASQEGRVLIMTTNHVEKLDKALIRPGRVDMIVEFGLADNFMTRNIFRNIFAYLEGDDDTEPDLYLTLDSDERKAAMDKKAKERAARDAKIEELADAFAVKIPAHEFSPAELQGHLMKHKHDPQAAVNTAEEFVVKTRKDHREKELKKAEEKRKAEEDEAQEAKKKVEEEKKKTEEAAKKNSEDEIRKKVEEEIQKTFGEEIKMKVEAEMKKKKKAEEDEAKETDGKKKTTSDEQGDTKPDNDTTTAASSKSSPASAMDPTDAAVPDGVKTTPVDEKEKLSLQVPTIQLATAVKPDMKLAWSQSDKGHSRQDSGYATPSSGEP